MLEKFKKKGKTLKRKFRRSPAEVGSSFTQKTLANLKNSVSREMREKAIGTMPEGTPFWKYSPNQSIILPKASSFKIRKFIP